MSGTEARASDDATPDDPRNAGSPPPVNAPDEGAIDQHAPHEPEHQNDENHREGHEPEVEQDPTEGPDPSWWHRSHPTFAGLVGFFTGVAYVIVVPGVYAALLGLLVSDATAQKLFPLVLVALVIPVALLVPRKTRRFAQFMFLGIVSTVVVVAVTAAVVIWALIQIDG